MARLLNEIVNWCYDLVWYVVDLRHRQPGRFFALTGAACFVIILMVIPLFGIGGNPTDVHNSAELESTTATDQGRQVRYVSYGGLANNESGQDSDNAASEQLIQLRAISRLSDVLRADLSESELIYGSDGREGSLLPIDNGVVPSSNPRARTDWELILPSAGIRAAVVQVGLTNDGAMGSPDNPFVVGWFNGSAHIGELGNALLGGHRDYQDREGNIDIGVCWELDETQVGDQLVMFDRSSARYYVYDIVDRSTILPDSKEAERYLSQTRESVVTLITCSGEFDEETHSYEERLIVVALLRTVAVPDA